MFGKFFKLLYGFFQRIDAKLETAFGFLQDRSETLSTGGDADNVERIFAEDGTLLSRVEVRPDGLRQEDSYVDGVRVATRLIDIDDTEDWSEITNQFDETGRIAKDTIFDDGQSRVDTFINGVRDRTIQSDSEATNLFDWSTRDVSYDSSGTPISRLTRYDDGTSRSETFEGGERALVVQEDLVLTARIWDLISTAYDALGRVTDREMTFDTGVLREDQFSGGVRQKTNLTDTDGAEDWSQIIYLYSFDGLISSRQQFDDDGDVTLLLYRSGQRTERIIKDVDGDEPWEVQRTIYDDEGVATVEAFADGTDILAEYGPYFAEDSFLM